LYTDTPPPTSPAVSETGEQMYDEQTFGATEGGTTKSPSPLGRRTPCLWCGGAGSDLQTTPTLWHYHQTLKW